MSLRMLLPLAAVLCSVSVLLPQTARAEVRQCVTPDGQTLFTDRQCTDMGATARVREPVTSTARVQRSGGCARSVDDLVFEVRSAIDAHDANRLAGVYHWPGTSASAGFRIWDQLDSVVNRPLVDIVPIMSQAQAQALAESGDGAAASIGDHAPMTSNDALPADWYPQTTVGRNPVGLRIEQTLDHSATPSRTFFSLTQYFGCWWVRY